MAFLDETGLSTLWTKIKNTFAASAHTHSAASITGLATVASTGSYDDLSNTLASTSSGTGAIVSDVTISGHTMTVTKAALTSADIPSLDASKIATGTLAAARIPSLDASKITTGTISIERLPAAALERVVTVADQAARYALTSASVQLGDTVKQLDTGVMYAVVDVSKLNTSSGYLEYTAGTATSAAYATSATYVNGHTVSANVPSNAVFTDTHNSAYNYLGTSGATANAATATTNTTTYLTLVDGGTLRSNLQVKGAGATTVTASNGVLTISSVNSTYTLPSVFTGATATANGTSGLVKQPTSGQQSYLLAGSAAWVNPATLTVSSASVATSAGTITSTLPVSKGGTGATTLASAGIITSAGAQTITGLKTFNNDIYFAPYAGNRRLCHKWSIARGTSFTGTRGVTSLNQDSEETTMTSYAHWVNSGNNANHQWYCRRNTTSSTLFSINFGVVSETAPHLAPEGTTGVIRLGDAANSGVRWAQLYAATATISTSDERKKGNIQSVPDEVLDAWADVQWCQYQWKHSIAEKGENGARIHNGMIAQRIQSVFENHGLDISRYAFFCYDSWDARPAEYAEVEVTDENGNPTGEIRQEKLKDAVEAGDEYSLRYEDALAMEAAYQRRRADRAEARITALEQRLSELEQAIASLL